MRIAQISPLCEPVPPEGYGGTERVVSYLTEELVRQGHQVTLFASGDSRTAASLVPGCARSLRKYPADGDPLTYHVLLAERVTQMAHRFDILHFHIDHVHYPISRREHYRHVTTLHGRLDLPELQPLYDEFDDMPVVSISQCQRAPVPQANWVGTVLHGLPADLFTYCGNPEGYLAFLGRISPEKRADRAIEIATRLGMPLRIAAKVDAVDREYFAAQIEPLLTRPGITFVGEIGGSRKHEFLRNAGALLFPIDWREPFGLVMIEAMACGTPVVAWRGGSVEEVITEGVSGFVVDTIDDAVAAARRAFSLDRHACRAAFEARFTAERMARDYIALYADLIGRRGERGERRAATQGSHVD